MSSGTTHDSIGFYAGLAIATGLAALIGKDVLSVEGTAVLLSGYALGISHFSPDVDTPRSRPVQRWGMLGFIWSPYQQTHGHRSFKLVDLMTDWKFRSHWPIVGSLERLVYIYMWIGFLAAIAGVAVWTLQPQTGIDLFVWASLSDWGLFYAVNAALWIGLEAAAIVHLFCDYCPILRHE